MNKSESIAALAAALSQAQAEMKPAVIDKVNPFLKSRYADLGAVIEAAKPVMGKYGLSYTQVIGGADGTVSVETVLMHKSGEWISGQVSLQLGEEKGKSQAQVAGSIVTYLRRYGLSAALGIYADEDDDAQPSKPVAQQAQQAQPKQNGNGNGASKMQEPVQVTMTLAEALEHKTPKGTKLSELNDKQLEYVRNNSKGDLHTAVCIIMDQKVAA